MIFVDYRSGSKELIAPLRALGLEVEKTTLDFADVAFEGRGLKGASVSIGIEFKQLSELVGALRTGRLTGHQMKGMRLQYEHSYLFIEGELLYDKAGALLRRKGKHRTTPLAGQMTVGELLKRIQVLHLCGGLNPWWTTSRADTLQSIVALYHTWTDQDLDKHKSHLGIYVAPTLIPVSGVRRTFTTFPGIGTRLSLAVEKRFGSVAAAVMASTSDWASIQTVDDKGKTRRLGNVAAQRIVDFCRGIK